MNNESFFDLKEDKIKSFPKKNTIHQLLRLKQQQEKMNKSLNCQEKTIYGSFLKSRSNLHDSKRPKLIGYSLAHHGFQRAVEMNKKLFNNHSECYLKGLLSHNY